MLRTTKRLQDACASYLLFLTTFRRNAKSSTLDLAGLHGAMERELQAVHDACATDPALSSLYDRVRYALVTTADQVILTSPWAHRAGWSMKLLEAHVYGTREGGQRFFQLVTQTLEDPSESAESLAAILFQCMGLGFQGELREDREELRRKRQQLFERARLSGSLGNKLTPHAYERNSDQSLLKLPTLGIIRFVLVGVGAILFAILVGMWATGAVTRDEIDAIDGLIQKIKER